MAMGILVIGLGVLSYLRMTTVAELTDEIQESENKLQRSDQIISQGQGLEDDLEEISEVAELLGPRLLTYEQFDNIGEARDRRNIMSQMNRMVEESLERRPLDLRMNPGSLEQMDYYRPLQFVMDVEGTLQELHNLLFHIEETANLLRVESLHLRPSEDTDNQMLTASIEFKVLAHKPGN